MGTSMLVGCRSVEKEQQREITIKEDVQLDSDVFPIEVKGVVESRLDGNKIRINVLENTGDFKAGDEVMVEYEGVNELYQDDTQRSVREEEEKTLLKEGTDVELSFWTNEMKTEDGQDIIVCEVILVKKEETSKEVLEEVKKTVDCITISYLSEKEQKVEKKITDAKIIGDVLDKVNTEYASFVFWSADDTIKEGYEFAILQEDKEIGTIKISKDGYCSVLVNEKLPWEQAGYQVENNMYQWAEELYTKAEK